MTAATKFRSKEEHTIEEIESMGSVLVQVKNQSGIVVASLTREDFAQQYEEIPLTA